MLELDRISHVYPDGTRALDKVSLRVPPGIYGLLGPGGSGKSTLVRILATLQRPTGGDLRFGGIDGLGDPAKLRRALGYLPQDFRVYDRMSAYQLLDHIALLKGIRERGERRAVVEMLLYQTDLWSARAERLGRFPPGMKQRFGIAQALVGNPALILLDEPTVGLAPEDRSRFLNLLSEIGDKVVVVLATQVVDVVADLCPAMAVLCDGTIRLSGRPGDLIASMSGRIWKRVIRADGGRRRYQGEHPVVASYLMAGQAVIHVLSDSRPNGFKAAEGGLREAYRSILAKPACTA